MSSLYAVFSFHARDSVYALMEKNPRFGMNMAQAGIKGISQYNTAGHRTMESVPVKTGGKTACRLVGIFGPNDTTQIYLHSGHVLARAPVAELENVVDMTGAEITTMLMDYAERKKPRHVSRYLVPFAHNANPNNSAVITVRAHRAWSINVIEGLHLKS